MSQNAILVETLDALQRGFNGSDNRCFAGAALLERDRRARIEARLEQADDIRRDGGMLDQRRPHVVLRIGHADLPQEAGHAADSATSRHISAAASTSAL